MLRKVRINLQQQGIRAYSLRGLKTVRLQPAFLKHSSAFPGGQGGETPVKRGSEGESGRFVRGRGLALVETEDHQDRLDAIFIFGFKKYFIRLVIFGF